jgi:SSS family transporter
MTWIDWTVFALYLIVTAGIGFWCGRNQKTTEDYFLGARQVPWWAAMLSLVATETSAVTVVAIPAQIYAAGGNMGFLQCALGFAVGKILISLFILPAYFQDKFSTPYEYLGLKLGRLGENLGAVLFMTALFVGAAFRIYVGAIPIREAAGLSLDVSLFIIAALAIGYTLMGGLRAVIYTDVFQMLLFLGGGALTLYLTIIRLPGSWETFWSEAGEMGKLDWFSWGLKTSETGTWYDWTDPHTIFAGLIGAVFVTLATHGTDHSNLQRLLACKSLGKARLALVVSAAVVFLQFFLFLSVGAAVAVFFAVKEIQPEAVSGNGILPYFIIHHLPKGLTGLLIAGIFAAAMSTVDSALSALSATTVQNWGSRDSQMSEAKSLSWARITVLVWGLVLWVGAEGAARLGRDDLIGALFAAANTLYGPLLGLFLIALFLVPKQTRPQSGHTWILIPLGLGMIVQLAVFAAGQNWWGQEPGPLFTLAWPWITLVGALSTFLPAIPVARLVAPR